MAHAAFTTPLFNEITSPMFSKGDELTISRRLASTHTQRLPPPLNSTSEPEMYTRKNTEQSLSYLKLPPWFVADANSIKILLPSDEKDTPRINGPATGSVNALTTNSDPAGKYTSYGAAEIGLEVPPLTSSTNTLTCKRYLPVSFPISSCTYARERDRERQRYRQRERDRERQREIERDRVRERERERER
jgi:hypothetical protein